MGDSGGPSESQVGDDPSTFDDEGVGYGNVNTTTEQALSDDPSIDSDFSAADAAAARADIQRQQGQIAQDLQQILPEAVKTRDDGYLAVDYSRVVPLLIQAIKELKAQIEDK